MISKTPLSPVGEIVRRHDPDRYFCTLFAPPETRETLFTLYAFNHELARAREAVREPFTALIRLQWWREIVEGARRRHEVAGPLGTALDEGRLRPEDLARMIEAREAEAEAMETLAEFTAYVRGSAGGVMVAAARALGMADAEALRPWGAAYGVAGILRSVTILARQGRCILPREMLERAGISEGLVVANPHSAALQPVRSELSSMARDWAREPILIKREARAATLPVVLARRDLRRRAEPHRGVGDRAAVAWAAIRGKV